MLAQATGSSAGFVVDVGLLTYILVAAVYESEVEPWTSMRRHNDVGFCSIKRGGSSMAIVSLAAVEMEMDV